MLIYDSKTDTCWTRKVIRMLQANVTPSVIAQQFRYHAMMIERPRKKNKSEQCQTVRIHDVIA